MKKIKRSKYKFKEKTNVFVIQGYCSNSNSFGQNTSFVVPNEVGQLGLQLIVGYMMMRSDISFKKRQFKCAYGSSSLFCRVCGAVKWKKTRKVMFIPKALESISQPLVFGSFWKGCSADPSGWDTHYQLVTSDPECALQFHTPTTSIVLPVFKPPHSCLQLKGKRLKHPMATLYMGHMEQVT